MAGYGIGESGSSGGGGGTPGGAVNNVQTNDGAGGFAGSNNFTYDPATGLFSVKDATGKTMLSLDPVSFFYAFGDVDGTINNGTNIQIDDNAANINISSQGTAGTISLNAANYTEIVGGLLINVATIDYGTTNNITTAQYHLATHGSGTGTTTYNLPASFSVGQKWVFSDVDRKSAANNIVIDAGGGKAISSQTANAQTYTIATDGGSVTIQAITSILLMVISTNA